MNKYHIFSIITAIMIIPIAAYFDAIIIENTNIKGYLIVCSIETFIFISGMLWGSLLERKELKKAVRE